MKNFVDKLILISISLIFFASCIAKYKDMNNKAIYLFNELKLYNSNLLTNINKTNKKFKDLKIYNSKNNIEFLFFTEKTTTCLVNTEIQQFLFYLKNRKQEFNLDNTPKLDSQGKLNKKFFEIDAFKVRKIKQLNKNWYYIIKEYNAD